MGLFFIFFDFVLIVEVGILMEVLEEVFCNVD